MCQLTSRYSSNRLLSCVKNDRWVKPGRVILSPSTINQRLAAIRKLASEAQRCGYVDSETARAIITVAGVSQKGRRLGRWLAWEEARTLLQAPNPHSIRGMRDRALLGVLVTCSVAPRRIVTDELRASGDARWTLGVSGFPGERK
jgi:site-specific recombinase XerD